MLRDEQEQSSHIQKSKHAISNELGSSHGAVFHRHEKLNELTRDLEQKRRRADRLQTCEDNMAAKERDLD